jgi:hypothetical protein
MNQSSHAQATAPASPNSRRLVRISESGSTGYSVPAIRRKIEKGVWQNGAQYIRAPDGCIFVDLDAVQAWVIGNRE